MLGAVAEAQRPSMRMPRVVEIIDPPSARHASIQDVVPDPFAEASSVDGVAMGDAPSDDPIAEQLRLRPVLRRQQQRTSAGPTLGKALLERRTRPRLWIPILVIAVLAGLATAASAYLTEEDVAMIRSVVEAPL
jgi:hypothetical protein